MKGIGGNITLQIQSRTATKNEIGEGVKTWKTVQALNGWLDYMAGDSKYTSFNAKLQETTHIFICDYTALDSKITAENSRALVNGKTYDILVIDNPMEMNEQLEIYLKFTGGQT